EGYFFAKRPAGGPWSNGECLLWVKCGHVRCKKQCPLWANSGQQTEHGCAISLLFQKLFIGHQGECADVHATEPLSRTLCARSGHVSRRHTSSRKSTARPSRHAGGACATGTSTKSVRSTPKADMCGCN